MNELLGNYEQSVLAADKLLESHGIDKADLVQCDAICYRVETNERYDEMKQKLGEVAVMLDETIISGRNIAVFSLNEPLQAGEWDSISYVELPQPKPGSPYPEGIDHVKYVTRQGLSQFRTKYSSVEFDEKGLVNELDQLLRLTDGKTGLKLHDKHMGAVIDLEHDLDFKFSPIAVRTKALNQRSQL